MRPPYLENRTSHFHPDREKETNAAINIARELPRFSAQLQPDLVSGPNNFKDTFELPSDSAYVSKR